MTTTSAFVMIFGALKTAVNTLVLAVPFATDVWARLLMIVKTVQSMRIKMRMGGAFVTIIGAVSTVIFGKVNVIQSVLYA